MFSLSKEKEADLFDPSTFSIFQNTQSKEPEPMIEEIKKTIAASPKLKPSKSKPLDFSKEKSHPKPLLAEKPNKKVDDFMKIDWNSKETIMFDSVP